MSNIDFKFLCSQALRSLTLRHLAFTTPLTTFALFAQFFCGSQTVVPMGNAYTGYASKKMHAIDIGKFNRNHEAHIF